MNVVTNGLLVLRLISIYQRRKAGESTTAASILDRVLNERPL